MSLLLPFLPLLLLAPFGRTAERKEVIGTIGSSVFLDPEHQADLRRSEILWTFTVNNKSPVTILDHVPDKSVEKPNEQFRSRLLFNASNGCLLVKNLKPEDQGVFTFFVDEIKTRTIELFLYYKLLKTLIWTNIDSGYTIRLTCEAAGNPLKYEWRKNGGEIAPHQWLINGNRSLFIQIALTGDCTTYTCITTNPVSSDQANYTLILPGISRKDAIIIIASTTGLVSSIVSQSGFLLLGWLKKKSKQVLQSLVVCSAASSVATFIALISWIVIKGGAFVTVVASCTVFLLLLAIIAPIVTQKLGCSFSENFQGKKGSRTLIPLSGFIIIPISIVVLKEGIQQNNQSCHTSILTWSIPIAILVSCASLIPVILAIYHYRNEDIRKTASIEVSPQNNEEL